MQNRDNKYAELVNGEQINERDIAKCNDNVKKNVDKSVKNCIKIVYDDRN